MEKVFSCNSLPENLEEMKKLNNYNLKDPFTTAFLTVLALVRYPEDKEAAIEMMNELKNTMRDHTKVRMMTYVAIFHRLLILSCLQVSGRALVSRILRPAVLKPVLKIVAARVAGVC